MSISDYIVNVFWHETKPINPKEGDTYFDSINERCMVYHNKIWIEMLPIDPEAHSREIRLENRDKLLTDILEKDA